MPPDIDQLTAALQRAHPGITIERLRTAEPDEDDEARWSINHPDALTAVQVGSSTGDIPFVVESELAAPTIAKSVDDAERLVTQRLGLGTRPRTR